MAIRTSDFTFLNFVINRLPRVTVTYESADSVNLNPSNVIEIKNDRIRLSAINTWMRAQVLQHASFICGNDELISSHHHLDVLRLVYSIITFAVFIVTLSTMSLQSVGPSLILIEFGLVL
jgi:hypothetical protein